MQFLDIFSKLWIEFSRKEYLRFSQKFGYYRFSMRSTRWRCYFLKIPHGKKFRFSFQYTDLLKNHENIFKIKSIKWLTTCKKPFFLCRDIEFYFIYSSGSPCVFGDQNQTIRAMTFLSINDANKKNVGRVKKIKNPSRLLDLKTDQVKKNKKMMFNNGRTDHDLDVYDYFQLC